MYALAKKLVFGLRAALVNPKAKYSQEYRKAMQDAITALEAVMRYW